MALNVLIASQQIRGVDGSGGLGDVPVGLAKILLSCGEADIRFIMPGFSVVSGGDNPGLKDRFEPKNRVCADLEVSFGDSLVTVDVYEVVVPGTSIRCYLIRCRDCDECDKQSDLHVVDGRGVPKKDTAPRAILFSRAVVEFVRRYRDFRVDLIHCNDWNTGLIPVYLHTIYAGDPYLSRVATLFTTHNAGGDAYQGGFPLVDRYRQTREPENLLTLANLDAYDLFRPGITRSLHHYGRFNFTKGALAFADAVNTVSLTYRRELLTRAFAGGLEGVVAERREHFAGIVNGIDAEEWNPAADPHLRGAGFSAADGPEVIRDRKRGLRSGLKAWRVGKKTDRYQIGDTPFATLTDDSILLGVVSRVDYQKAPILLGQIQPLPDDALTPAVTEEVRWRSEHGVLNPLEQLLTKNADVQIVVLGSANDPYGARFVNLLHDLRERWPTRLMFFDGFDIPLSHLLYATIEIFMQPSMFEPCGLTQLVAMLYGGVPVVRAVGGLVDTVIDYGSTGAGNATGFTFLEPSIEPSEMVNLNTAPSAFVAAVERALRVIREPSNWNRLVASCTRRDSSWDIPARQYVRLYQYAMQQNLGHTFF